MRTCPDVPLSPIPESAVWSSFDFRDHFGLRQRIRKAATATGLAPRTVDDVVLAVNEAVVNTVRHAGGEGRLCTWTEGGSFLCEVRDPGRIGDAMAGRRKPPIDTAGGRGLWLITQLCDLVQIRELAAGQAIRIRVSDRA
jgi:anti-sigma regulatory factor (Ser/Thr protein kinase)